MILTIILKILLAIISIGGIYTTYFVINEYRKFFKSQKREEGSLFERFTIALLAFSGILFLACATFLSILFLFSKITIELFF